MTPKLTPNQISELPQSQITDLVGDLAGKEPTITKNTAFNKNFGGLENTVTEGNDPRLSNSREWSAGTVSQVEAETGTATTRRAWTSQRVRQSIVSWWGAITGTDIRDKLGITTLSGDNTGDQTTITGNAGSATKLQTARTIGGVSFNGTSNINLPGVNTTGNQNTTGNAATVTNGVYSTAGTPSGADRITQIVSLTQAEYTAASKVSTTLYIITDA